MAKLRRNHTKESASLGGGMIARVGLFSLILVALYFAFQKLSGGPNLVSEDPVKEDVGNLEQTGEDSIFYLPACAIGELVKHQFYALSYVEKFELPEWVAYELTSERLNGDWVDKSNDFRPDPKVPTGSATPNDYKNTSYDQGRLVPAADMTFAAKAMSETFYLSNIAPQESGFNKGVWRELEELARDWAKRSKHLYVVTGPVLTQPIKFWLGENQVAVPPAFYKILLDIREPEIKAIAFIIPNAATSQRIETFATSIDEVEKLTGIDFFPNLLEQSVEEKLESEFDTGLWKTNDKKYQTRVQEWNFK